MLPYTRREFAKLALSVLPAAGMLSIPGAMSGAEKPAQSRGKPNSKVAGVQIGINVPYSFGGNAAAAFRKKYEDAGVRIEILKVDNIFKISEAELDYVFALGKAVGARALSSEISKSDDDHKRVGRFADKHQMMVGYHGHATTTPEHWEKAFSFAKYNGANVDIGHFVAGNNVSPADFIKKHHARVTHVHIKDRKRENGPNMVFGEGDTPIVEILRLIRDNKWNMQATIEFEYKVPAGSDRMTEIARAVKYCRDALA